MISSSDRIIAIELIEQAHVSGARYFVACKEIGISVRTLERWKNKGDNVSDCRIGSIHPTPPNALSEQERQAVLEVCHKEEFSSLPPAQIVPILADRGIYLASESTFYRILAANGENKHRSRSKPPQKREVTKHEVSGPNQVWVTDISWLRGPVKGLFYYLYFVMDLYSRKIVGFEVYETESSKHLADVVQKATLRERTTTPQILHSDNGSPMKGSDLLELCYSLGIVNTYSRPRVSNDNAHIEAIFKTVKYCPTYPYGGFKNLDTARKWTYEFVDGYNTYHRHSALNHLTSGEKHDGKHLAILQQRHELYCKTQLANPNRWINAKTRNWTPTEITIMNAGRKDQKVV